MRAVRLLVASFSALAFSLGTAVVTSAALARKAEPDPGGTLARIDRATLSMIIAESGRLPHLERVARVSRLFLGTPYQLDPLGEGPGGSVDKDPLFDLGHVDCQTFVEQVMALAAASNFQDFERRLRQIRYRDDNIDFKSRYHLMALGWIPGNTRTGFIRELTREVAGDKARVAQKVVDARQWRGKYHQMFRRLGKAAPSGLARLDYVPLADVMSVASKLPVASVAYVVTKPAEGIPYLVRHMGLLLREPDGRYIFRHASADRQNRSVVDVSLNDYLGYLDRTLRKTDRPVLGLAFSALLPGPALRVSEATNR